MSGMDIIKAALPTLATAFGGPLAGMAAQFFASKLGLPEGTVEAVKNAIGGATPETLLEMKKIDADLQKHMADLSIDLEKVAAADRDSARQRETRTGDSLTPRILAGIIVGSFLYMVYLVLSGHVAGLKDPTVAATIGTLIGYVSAKADQIVSYYFGSTASSREKNKLLADSAPK